MLQDVYPSEPKSIYIHYIWMLELCIIYVIVSMLVCLYEYVDGGLQSVVISTVFSSILHMTPHYHITIYRVDREFNICIDDVRVLEYTTSIRIFYLHLKNPIMWNKEYSVHRVKNDLSTEMILNLHEIQDIIKWINSKVQYNWIYEFTLYLKSRPSVFSQFKTSSSDRWSLKLSEKFPGVK